jgi:hypothetical protein
MYQKKLGSLYLILFFLTHLVVACRFSNKTTTNKKHMLDSIYILNDTLPSILEGTWVIDSFNFNILDFDVQKYYTIIKQYFVSVSCLDKANFIWINTF